MKKNAKLGKELDRRKYTYTLDNNEDKERKNLSERFRSPRRGEDGSKGA
jgi:hypothetical protein